MQQRMLDVGVAPGRLACVPNWADTQRVCPIKRNNRFRLRHGLQDRFVVMYSGNLGLTQRLDRVLAAAHRLRDRADIVFVFVGDGASRDRLVQESTALRLPNVHFYGYQPKKQLADTLSAADVHLVPLAPELVSCLMPSKLYGILASGTPVLAMAPKECELARIVQRHDVGMVIPPHDPAGLAEAIRRCRAAPDRLAQMGRAARRLAVGRYDRQRSAAVFGRLLFAVLGRSTTPAADITAGSFP
jgi:glycosyltransferase involved in cell wall biosynthesis